MRVGLFIDSNEQYFSFKELIAYLGDSLVGYSSQTPNAEISKYARFEPYPLELLAGCDIALMFSTNEFFETLPSAAVRRGIHVYLADLPSCSKKIILDLKSLTQEIDVAIEFGFSGIDIATVLPKANLLNTSFFLDCTRDISSLSDPRLMRRALIYDISTLVRLKYDLIKKLRVVAFPIASPIFSLLNMRFEISTGSVFCYTLSRLNKDETFVLNLYCGEFDQLLSIKKDTLISNANQTAYSSSPIKFLEMIAKGGRSKFSIDKALEVFRLLDDINQKLLMYQ